MADPRPMANDGDMDQTFDRSSLGAFLRIRRSALQPEDVGLRRGRRRRTPGLRREEVAELCAMSADYFARLWQRHEGGLRWSDTKRFVRPQVGPLELSCHLLLEPDQRQSLLIFTTTPGTESHEKLALLTVPGTDRFAPHTR